MGFLTDVFSKVSFVLNKHNIIQMKNKQGIRATILILVVLLLDQALKIYVKTTFALNDGFNILGLSWAQIKFVENNGMALGLELGGAYGKIALSVFRVVACVLIVLFMRKSIQENKSNTFIFALALVIAGAAGNIIDGIFYGNIFSSSDYFEIATLFPTEGGYASFFEGKVVDMLYFPIIDTHFPTWLPIFGGQEFRFNNYIFNLADLSITIGVIVIFTVMMSDKKKGK
jgi:signal peptidase II